MFCQGESIEQIRRLVMALDSSSEVDSDDEEEELTSPMPPEAIMV